LAFVKVLLHIFFRLEGWGGKRRLDTRHLVGDPLKVPWMIRETRQKGSPCDTEKGFWPPEYRAVAQVSYGHNENGGPPFASNK
jgi:hypothetical protein